MDNKNNSDEYLYNLASRAAKESLGEGVSSDENLMPNEIATEPASESYQIQSVDQNANNFAPKKKRNRYSTETLLFAFILIFGMALVVTIYIFNIWLTPIQVIGTSMQPTINTSVTSESDEDHSDIVYYLKANSYNNNDIIIIDNTKLTYIDMTAFGYEKDDSPNYLIKRVVATGGQTIRFYITSTKQAQSPTETTTYYYQIIVYDENGENINLDQSYLGDDDMCFTLAEYNYYSQYWSVYAEIFGGMLEDEDGYDYEVKENCYFAMGDNRNNSTDSRFFGEIEYDDICGSVRLILAYGDNIFVAIYKKFKYGSY